MKKILASACAGLLTASLLWVSPAYAAISLKSVTMGASAVIIDGNAGCGNRFKVEVKVSFPAAEQGDVFTVTGEATKPGGDIADFLLFNQTSRSGDTVTYSEQVYICGFEDPGKYQLTTKLVYWNGTGTSEQTRVNTYYVKRPTTLTYNATPEPAKRGANVTHSGRLMFDPFGYGNNYGPSGVAVKLSFKKAGTSTYVAKGTVTTTKGGYYSKKLRADADGTWRAEYPNNTYRQTQSKTDYVDTV